MSNAAGGAMSLSDNSAATYDTLIWIHDGSCFDNVSLLGPSL